MQRSVIGLLILFFYYYGLNHTFGREPGLSMIIYRIGHPPKIDGRLNDMAWTSASRVELMRTPRDEKLSGDLRTYVMAVYDNANVYFAFLNEDSHTDDLQSTLSEHDRDVCNEDCVSVSVEPGNTGKGPLFYVAVNPGNTTRDVWLPPKGLRERIQNHEIPPELFPIALAYTKGIDWEPKGLQTATQVNKTSWTVEIKISFEDLFLSGAPINQTWGGNFIRHAVGWGDAWKMWSRPKGDFATNSEEFGDLIFGK